MIRLRSSALGFVALGLAWAGSVVTVAQHPLTPESSRDGAVSAEPSSPRIRIDAVVTDRTQSPILDLRAGDFELLENGVAQKIESVELRTRRRSTAANDASPIRSAGDETRAARQPGTHAFALFLDEFHVSPGATSERVRSALSAFIDQLQPGDLALAIKPLDSLTSLRFTRDRAPLRAAVESFAGRKGDPAPRTPFEEQYIGRALAAVALARAQISTAVLRELALKFGELEADRGVFVIVSEGFPRVNTGRLSRNSDVQGVVRAASRSNTAMYTFNPADLEEVGAVDPSKNDTPVGMLQWLALQTGGRAVLDGRVLGPGLRRMTDDLDAYYVLTYQPRTADGRFHPVEVKAKRRDAQVQTPPGYWAPLGGEWRAVLDSSSRTFTPRRALRRSAIIDVWTGIARDADGRMRLQVTWEPRVTLAHPPQVVVLKAQTPAGVRLFEGQLSPVGTRGAAIDRALFDAPPGRVELDLTIQSVEGTTLDTDARDVDVPALDARTRGPVFLTPEIIRARTMRELNVARTDPNATPTPDRSFSRSDQLLIRTPTWDGSGVPVQVTAYVLNRWGQPMRPVTQTDASGVSQFELPLSWLAAGDYYISLTAKNANGQAAERLDIKVNR
jgi:VWFA-related protein